MKNLQLLSILMLISLTSFSKPILFNSSQTSLIVVDDIEVWITRPCYNSNNGKIDLKFADQAAKYSVKYFKWTNSQTSELIKEVNDIPYGYGLEDLTQGVTAGYYTVEIKNNTCGYTTIDIEVLEFEEIVIKEPMIKPSCNNADDGSISFVNNIVCEGGTEPYTYIWSNGDDTPSIYNLEQGQYELKISDNNGCKQLATFEVNNSLIVFNNPVIHDACHSLSTGSIVFNHADAVSGGQAPYNYLWSTGAPFKDLYDKPAGSYSITVTDVNFCSVTKSFTIESSSKLKRDDVINIQNTSCGLNQGSVSIYSNDNTLKTFEWAYPINIVEYSSFSEIENLSAGIYWVKVSDNGCYYWQDIKIEETNDINFEVNVYNELCGNDGAASLSIPETENINNYNITWSNGSSAREIKGLPGGTYSVTVTKGSCTESKEFEISETFAVVRPTTCFPDYTGSIALLFNTDINASIVWSTGQSNVYGINNLAQGLYSVTISTNQCTKIEMFNLTSTLAGNFVNSQSIECNNGLFNLLVDVNGNQNDLTFNWSNGETDKDLLGVSSGEYYLTISNSFGCTKVTHFSVPLFSFDVSTFNSVFCGDEEFQGYFVIDKPKHVLQSYNYGLFQSNFKLDDRNYVDPGIYNLTISYNNCHFQSEIVIEGESDLGIELVSLRNPKSCVSEDGMIEVKSNSQAYISWDFEGRIGSKITELGAGVFKATAHLGYCEVFNSYVLEADKSGLFDLTYIKQAECLSSGVVQQLGAIQLGNYHPDTKFKWLNYSSTSTFISELHPAMYMVEATLNKCKQNETYFISCCKDVSPIEVSSIVKQCTNAISKDGAIEITGSNNYTYSWSSSNGFSSNEKSVFDLKAGYYNLFVTDGCSMKDFKFLIYNVEECSRTQITIFDEEVCLDESIENHAQILSPKVGNCISCQYKWSTGSNKSFIEIKRAGEYTVTVTDINYCTSEYQYSINKYKNLDINVIVNPYKTWADCDNSIGFMALRAMDDKNYYIRWDKVGNFELMGNIDYRFYTPLPAKSFIEIKSCGINKVIEKKFACTKENGDPCDVNISITKEKECWDECDKPILEGDCAKIICKSLSSNDVELSFPDGTVQILSNSGDEFVYEAQFPDKFMIYAVDESGCSKSFLVDYSVICEPSEWNSDGNFGSGDDVVCPKLKNLEIEKGEDVVISFDLSIMEEDLLIRFEIFSNSNNQILQAGNLVAFDGHNEFEIGGVGLNDVTIRLSFPDFQECNSIEKNLTEDVDCPEPLLAESAIFENTARVSILCSEQMGSATYFLYKIDNNKLIKVSERTVNLVLGNNFEIFDISHFPENTKFKVDLIFNSSFTSCGAYSVYFSKIKTCPYFVGSPSFANDIFKVKIFSSNTKTIKLTLFTGQMALGAKQLTINPGTNLIEFEYNVQLTSVYHFQFSVVGSNCPVAISDGVNAYIQNPDPPTEGCKNIIDLLYLHDDLIAFNAYSLPSGNFRIIANKIDQISFDSLSKFSEFELSLLPNSIRLDKNDNILTFSNNLDTVVVSNFAQDGSLIWNKSIPEYSIASVPSSASHLGYLVLIRSINSGSYKKIEINQQGNIVSEVPWNFHFATNDNTQKQVFLFNEVDYSVVANSETNTIVHSIIDGISTISTFSNSLKISDVIKNNDIIKIVGTVKDSFNLNGLIQYNRHYSSPVVISQNTRQNNSFTSVFIKDFGKKVECDKAVDINDEVIIVVKTPLAGIEDSSLLLICDDIISANISSCVCNSLELTINYSAAECKLTWDPTCTNFNFVLQRYVLSQWIDIPTSSFSFELPSSDNGTYRLKAHNDSCGTFYGNPLRAIGCTSPCACNPVLYKIGCHLTWQNTCPGYVYALQMKSVGGNWINVNYANSPFSFVGKEGVYRLKLSKEGCDSKFSNELDATCNTYATCDCYSPPINYDSDNCILSWDVIGCLGYSVQLERKINSSWLSVNTNGNNFLSLHEQVPSYYRLKLYKSECDTIYSGEGFYYCTWPACVCNSLSLDFDSIQCTLSWNELPCNGFEKMLQVKEGQYWTDIINAESPYYVDQNNYGEYRLLLEKENCDDLTSEVVNVDCISINCDLVATISGNLVNSCSNVLINVTGGIAPYSYSWVSDGSLTSAGTNSNINEINTSLELGGSSGNYYITVTDVVGCTATMIASYSKCDCICDQNQICGALNFSANGSNIDFGPYFLNPTEENYYIKFNPMVIPDRLILRDNNFNIIFDSWFYGLSPVNCSDSGLSGLSFKKDINVPEFTPINDEDIVPVGGNFAHGIYNHDSNIDALTGHPDAGIIFVKVPESVHQKNGMHIEIRNSQLRCTQSNYTNYAISVSCNPFGNQPEMTLSDSLNLEIQMKDDENTYVSNVDYKKFLDSSFQSNNIIIYPNPSNSSFTVDLTSEMDEVILMKITNNLGINIFSDLLYVTKGDNRYFIVESESWPAGVYYVDFLSDKLKQTVKLLKMK